MTKMDVLLIACVGFAAAPGCAADWSDEEADEAQAAEEELALDSEAVTPNALGEFHLIRLANTQLCVQPLNGSRDDVELELRPCISSSPAQNWLFSQKASNEWQIINAQTGNCMYVDTGAPLWDGASPIIQGGCNIFGTNVPVSNALWKPQRTVGLTQLQSRIQHRDSGFCFDVPGGNPFDGARMWMYRCNGTPAQAWIVGQE